MSGVELSIGIAGAADLCFRYGRIADTDITEKVLIIKAIWMKISFQLNLLKQIWSSIDQDTETCRMKFFLLWLKKYSSAGDGEVQRGFLSRSRYVILVKKSLDQAIQELKDWQATFDTTWFLTTTYFHGQIMDTELAKESPQSITLTSQKGVFLPPDRLAAAHSANLPFSTTQLIKDLGLGLPSCILDCAECAPDTDVSILTRDVRTLASRLQTVNPHEFHLLNCFGVVKAHSDGSQRVTSFNFIFRIPKSLSEPKSFREHLVFLTGEYSITSKVRLAKQLVIAVSFVHTLGSVHKNICPETILIFKEIDCGASSLFLTGFKTCRMADGKTLRKGDIAWETNLYRHPDRHLGVCHLEIGLGSSFVRYGTDGEISSDHKSDYLIGLDDLPSIKTRLYALAVEHLPNKMGEIYTRVVLNCLTCTDEENEDFGDEMQFYDEDGVLIGVAYIEKILLQLDTISI
ncbi:hypothetical protein BJX70DRAFT_390704 [Aspergillus crustosus]